VISRLRALWDNLFRRKKLDRDLDEELLAYVELVSAEQMRQGVSPEEAYRQARRDAGGLEQVKESVRDVRAGVWLDSLARDLRYLFRTLAKNWRQHGNVQPAGSGCAAAPSRP
jgi:macrolide transport system ATP-binding/permease protein